MNQTTHKMTDPIQIKHYKEDITSFNQLYKEFQRRFVRFANTYVRDLTTAEDITIEAMMYYWENRQSLSEDSNIPAYILTIIKNKCLNYLRHQQIHEEKSAGQFEHAVVFQISSGLPHGLLRRSGKAKWNGRKGGMEAETEWPHHSRRRRKAAYQ